MPISALEKLQEWISCYPGWDACLQNVCILPQKMEEISRQKDVLGNTLVGYRCYVTLNWEMPTLTEETQNTHRLLRFIQWVQHQSAVGYAPCFGDVPARERIRTEKGGLIPGNQTVTYTVTLVVDYMKNYEVKK